MVHFKNQCTLNNSDFFFGNSKTSNTLEPYLCFQNIVGFLIGCGLFLNIFFEFSFYLTYI